VFIVRDDCTALLAKIKSICTSLEAVNKELSAAQLGKSCAGEHGANMETEEEIDERDPKFIREETEAAVERAYDQIAKDQASFATSVEDLNRLRYELPLWKKDFDRRREATIVRGAEWLEMLRDAYQAGKDLQVPNEGYCYTVCSMEEARKILGIRPPVISMVVRPSKAEREVMRLLTIEDYLVHLKNMNKIDVHRYDVPVDLEGEYRIPKKLNAADAIELLCNKKTGPVNFLNLEGWRPNPEPPFLDNLWSYRLFRAVRNDGISGKMIDQNPYDLSACGAFQILGKTGVFSLCHLDHEGAITCCQNDEGEKLWPTWPRESPEQLRERSGSSPVSRPFVIHLRCFDWLVQPSRTEHSPYTNTTCLMTGTMYWHSEELLEIMEQKLAELENPNITNEDVTLQFDRKMSTAMIWWRERRKPYTWGRPEDYEKCQNLFKVRNALELISSGKS
jgi:hypothetical protein